MRVVTDTNVLVSALLAPGGGPGAVLAAVDADESVLVATPELFDELEAVLARDRFRAWVSVEQAEAYVRGVRRRAELVGDPDEVDVLTPRQLLDRLA